MIRELTTLGGGHGRKRSGFKEFYRTDYRK